MAGKKWAKAVHKAFRKRFERKKMAKVYFLRRTSYTLFDLWWESCCYDVGKRRVVFNAEEIARLARDRASTDWPAVKWPKKLPTLADIKELGAEQGWQCAQEGKWLTITQAEEAGQPSKLTPADEKAIKQLLQATWDYIAADILEVAGGHMPAQEVQEAVADHVSFQGRQHPHTYELWKSLSDAEQLRLLKMTFKYDES